MSVSDQNFPMLMKRVLAGSEEAAEQLHDEYGPIVRGAVRSNLSQQLRSKFDSLEFVQEVWAAFFGNLPAEDKFDRPERLIAFLKAIAYNKIAKAARRCLAREQDTARRECSLDREGAVPPAWIVAH